MHAPVPAPIAAIDIGSNSIQLTLARVEDAQVVELARIKDAARLGAALDREGRLSPAAVERAVQTLARFRAEADAHGAKVRATATAALRQARDGEAFLQRVRDEVGINIEIISGAEEARLVFTGVLFGLPELASGTPLCVDVGGGSTELVVGRGGRPVLTASLPLGALTVCRRWLGADPIARHRVRAARRFIAGALRARAGAVERFGFTAAVGTGGSIQRLARIAAALKGAPTEDVHGHFLDTKALDAVVERLVHARTQAERLALPGMDPDRADTLLGGALIFQALAHLLRLDGWRVSMTALRTGLLVDTHRRAVG